MRVLFLQRQPCIRALKYAVALRAARPEIRLGFAFQGRSLTGWYGTGDELFDRLWTLPHRDPAATLRQVVSDFRPDVVHSHNLPDVLTVTALGLGPGRPPVVHDVHDLGSLRRTPYEDGFPDAMEPLAAERAAVEGADGLIVVSREMMDAIAARHRPPAHRAEVPNLALARDLPGTLPPADRPAGRPLRIAYQGTLSENGSHYDLRALLAGAAAQGLRVDVLPNRPVPAYRNLAAVTPGLRVLPQLPPDRLMQALTGYDLGWALFNGALNRPHLDTALPNKAYEYLGAGLPLVTGEHRALRRLVEGAGVGVAVSGVAGLRRRLEGLDMPALRRRVAAMRPDITVEGAIGRVLALYAAVAGGASPAPPSAGASPQPPRAAEAHAPQRLGSGPPAPTTGSVGGSGTAAMRSRAAASPRGSSRSRSGTCPGG